MRAEDGSDCGGDGATCSDRKKREGSAGSSDVIAASAPSLSSPSSSPASLPRPGDAAAREPRRSEGDPPARPPRCVRSTLARSATKRSANAGKSTRSRWPALSVGKSASDTTTEFRKHGSRSSASSTTTARSDGRPACRRTRASTRERGEGGFSRGGITMNTMHAMGGGANDEGAGCAGCAGAGEGAERAQRPTDAPSSRRARARRAAAAAHRLPWNAH